MSEHEPEKPPTGPRAGGGKASRRRARPLEVPAKGRLLEVQQFAVIVKEFTTEVQTFYERRVEDRLATENLQTRFKNGLARM